jgi:hypothetical protein
MGYLAATVTADRPIGVIDFDRPAIDEVGNDRNVTMGHARRVVEDQNRAMLRSSAACVMTERGVVPPLPGVARNLERRNLMNELNAVQGFCRNGGAHECKTAYNEA